MFTFSPKSVATAAAITLSALLIGCADQSSERRIDAEPDPCRTLTHRDAPFTVCSYPASADIRLFHSDAVGEPYLQFETLAREIEEQSGTLIFAMNGGMYHEDRAPVGYYRDTLGEQASLNLNDGPGNFHLKPNGVFWLKSGRAGVMESAAYAQADLDPTYATQSGPMLVINGALHPLINPEGTSRKRRNGVGVSADGKMVHFAISDAAVTFYEFATLFQNVLETPNALFLDGQISRLYAPGIERYEPGLPLGPIVGVVE